MFSLGPAQALMFSLGPAQALVFSLGPAQALIVLRRWCSRSVRRRRWCSRSVRRRRLTTLALSYRLSGGPSRCSFSCGRRRLSALVLSYGCTCAGGGACRAWPGGDLAGCCCCSGLDAAGSGFFPCSPCAYAAALTPTTNDNSVKLKTRAPFMGRASIGRKSLRRVGRGQEGLRSTSLRSAGAYTCNGGNSRAPCDRQTPAVSSRSAWES